MAGETTTTAAGTTLAAGRKLAAKLATARVQVATDVVTALTSAELQATDKIKFAGILIPSNAVILGVSHYNNDLDTHACAPTLDVDVGVSAAADYTSVTSGTETDHAVDDVIDADLFVDGSTALRAATTSWTAFAQDTATFGPDDANKEVWELLGYDEDPQTVLNLLVTAVGASATLASGGVLAIRVDMLVK